MNRMCADVLYIGEQCFEVKHLDDDVSVCKQPLVRSTNSKTRLNLYVKQIFYFFFLCA